MANDLSEILKSIDELAARAKLSRQRAFAAWYAIYFRDLDEDDALEAAAADGGNDQGIDLVFADDASEQIVVIQAFCPENLEKATPKNKWDALVSCLAFVRNPKSLKDAGRPDLADSINEIIESNKNYEINLSLISLGKSNDQIAKSVAAHQKLPGSGVTYSWVSQELIIENYRALVESSDGVAEDYLNFTGGYLKDEGEYGRAWLGSVSAEELIRLHGEHGTKLYAGNIRLFLGARKGGINEQIIATAKDDPGNFWALNNGITIVADHADAIESENTKLKLKRFSIVNGCQTTNSLVRSGSAAAKVLARVIAAKSNLRNDIVRFNNSQNAIKIWTVRAADKTQQNLQRQFKKIGIEYAPRQDGARKKTGKNTIELDKLAQYIASSDKEFLIQAIDNKGELFDQPYQKIFPKDISERRVYLSWLVGLAADEARKKLLDEIRDNSNGLLTVTAGFWIVYTAFVIFSKFSDVNSIHITLERFLADPIQSGIPKSRHVCFLRVRSGGDGSCRAPTARICGIG
ncbi:AIPR family protein, partial [Ancylobacter sp. G4_0304]|uniref:AIPR family protein n=1 Tax=Ancylobacter sp. G4_0304 TaxID=3114289 RepID=UPI0039C63A5B